MNSANARALNPKGRPLRRQAGRSSGLAEALAVFEGGDEGFDHLGAADARQRHALVAHVLAGEAEAVELREPEVVALEAEVGVVSRATAQVAEVLREDEARVELPVVDRPEFDDAPERPGPPID